MISLQKDLQNLTWIGRKFHCNKQITRHKLNKIYDTYKIVYFIVGVECDWSAVCLKLKEKKIQKY